MTRRLVVMIGLLLFCVSLNAQAPKEAPKKRIAVRAGRLIDGKSDQPIANAMIVVEDGKIVSVTPGGSAPAGVEVIDLSHATVLSGLTDAHTHVLLQGDVTAADYDEQLLKQSIPYRAILAARNAKIALDHGFTTLRDLETEGAMYADVDVKKAINRGEVPGPHMFVSTRAMTPTGMYPLLGYSWEIEVPHGVQFVDGVDNARLAVREQISHGADWIKYYSDRAYYFGSDGVLHSHVNFTDEEARAIVEETHRLGHKVAAHSIGSDGIAASLARGGGFDRAWRRIHGGAARSGRETRRVLVPDGDGGGVRGAGPRRKLGADGCTREESLRAWREKRRKDCDGDGCGRVSVD